MKTTTGVCIQLETKPCSQYGDSVKVFGLGNALKGTWTPSVHSFSDLHCVAPAGFSQGLTVMLPQLNDVFLV